MHIPNKKELESKTKPKYGKDFNIEVTDNIYFRLFGQDYMIPKGFVSDGASLPFFLKPFMNKLSITWLFGAIVHDYLYRTQFIESRAICDLIFKIILKETAGNILPYFFYLGVRAGGWLGWYKNSKNLQKFPQVKHDLLRHQIEIYNLKD